MKQHGIKECKVKNSFLTSKITQCVSITIISWLVLFKEIITVHSENHRNINAFCGQNAALLSVKVGGTYSRPCALKS
jgi:hypothetical protein